MSKSRVKAVALSLIALFFLSTIAISLSAPSKDFPPNTATSTTEISISSGEIGATIAKDLARLGVILRSSTFLSLATHDSRALSISPGIHRIEKHITSAKALAELLDPALNSGLVRVPEGSTFSDVLSLLHRSGVKGDPGVIKVPEMYSHSGSLEGLLAPATYSFGTEITTSAALREMISHFMSQSKNLGLDRGYKRYSPYDVLKIASMVQIEADPIDFAKAARVIYNRLKINMPLQLNSTVQYANHTRGKIALSKNSISRPSLYNTYLHTGLPPTPISNPSSRAVQASLDPADGDWLYFVTVKPHDTRFTSSYAEFEGWVTLYNNNLANGAFK